MQPQTHVNIIRFWLFLCLLLIMALMMLSGLIRLHESAHIITAWRPVGDILPTAGAADFEKEFEIYRALPQFQKYYPEIEIGEFTTIYKYEYVRYILNCALVIVAILPLFLFSVLQIISGDNILKLLTIFIFGGVQYVAYRYVVDRSFQDDAYYTPYWMSGELALQFICIGLLLWRMLSFGYPKQDPGGFPLPAPSWQLKALSCLTLGAVFLQIIFGGAVSGLNAGQIFNTFPQMDNFWIPEGLWPNPIWLKNLYEDPTTAQFVHRALAYGLSLLVVVFWIVGNKNPHVAHLLPILLSLFVVQFLLGVLTLLFTVPVPLASLHQVNAILIFIVAVAIVHRLFIPVKTISYDIGVI